MNINARIILENTWFRKICAPPSPIQNSKRISLTPLRAWDSMTWKIRTRNLVRWIFDGPSNISLSRTINFRDCLATWWIESRVAAAHNRRSVLAIEEEKERRSRVKKRQFPTAEMEEEDQRDDRADGFLLAGFPAFTRDGTRAPLLPNGQRNRWEWQPPRSVRQSEHLAAFSHRLTLVPCSHLAKFRPSIRIHIFYPTLKKNKLLPNKLEKYPKIRKIQFSYS